MPGDSVNGQGTADQKPALFLLDDVAQKVVSVIQPGLPFLRMLACTNKNLKFFVRAEVRSRIETRQGRPSVFAAARESSSTYPQDQIFPVQSAELRGMERWQGSLLIGGGFDGDARECCNSVETYE